MTTDDFDALDTYYQLTLRYPNGRTLEWLNEMVRDYGDERVSMALAVASKGGAATVLSRTQDILRREAHRAAAEAETRRQAELRREQEDYESRMPPEQRAENLARLRAEMERMGLL